MERVIVVDRAAERHAIGTLLADAAAGRGGALVLHGEPGIGKTTLLRYAAAQAEGFTVLSVAGSEGETALPFAGLHRLLELVLHHLDDPARESDHPVHDPDGQVCDEARRLLRAVEAGYRDDERFAVSVGVLRAVRAAARQRPVLCLADDTHWLDRQTRQVLEFLARRVDGEPVAVVLAGDDAGDDRLAAGPPSGVPAYRLAPLDHRGAHALVADLVPAEDVAGALVATAHGNPRALLDLARSLSPEQRRGDAPPPARLPPESRLRHAYRARLAGQPAATRWLLLLAAADGEFGARGLGVGELSRAAAASGTDLDALRPAESAGLIDVGGAAGRADLPEGAGWADLGGAERADVADAVVTFRQPLMRSVVYHEAPAADRHAAHRVLARTLNPATQALRHHLHRAAARPGPDDVLAAALERAATRPGTRRATASRALERAAELSTRPECAALRLLAAARHAWLGGESHRARMLLRRARAGTATGRVRAHAELLGGEIELAGGDTAAARRSLLTAAVHLAERDRHLAIAALVRAGEALCQSGDYDRYPAVARRALALRRADEPPAVELMLEQMAGLAALFQGDYAAAAAPLRRVVALARALDEPAALSQAGAAAFLLGDDVRAHRLATRLAEVARTGGDLATVPHALDLMAAADFALGHYDTAASTYQEAVRLARLSGQESLATNELGALAVLAALGGDRQTCALRVREVHARTAGDDAGRSRSLGDWALAVLDLVDGRPADAVTRLRRLMGVQPAHGHLVVKVAATPHLVEAAALCGDRETAAGALKAFDPWMVRTGKAGWLALSARCHALVTDSDGEADEYFREALRHHQVGASEFERARTELLYGQRLRRRRQPGAAREYLRSALETFERFDARPWVGQATAELRAAGDRVQPHRVRVADSLTPQQAQIARLVADGATNREVAERLFLSRRTVEYHLRNIFTRLGVRSRVELTRLMG
ncbi:AAA family ATPase [Planosporangium sp. 12N6]|uniref:AAA family ATPase n=1 Tax=Planosporangium spinosum TaxID=3402278 RepID=UPI003CF9E3A0